MMLVPGLIGDMVAVWPVGFGHSAGDAGVRVTGWWTVGVREGVSVTVGDGLRASVGESVGSGVRIRLTVAVAI